VESGKKGKTRYSVKKKPPHKREPFDCRANLGKKTTQGGEKTTGNYALATKRRGGDPHGPPKKRGEEGSSDY